MVGVRAQRWAAVAGIVTVLLVVADVILSPDFGDPGSSTARIIQLSLKSRDGILGFMFVDAFSSILLLGFIAGLTNMLRRDNSESVLAQVAVGGGIAFVVFDLLDKIIVAALTYRVTTTGDRAVVRAIFDIHLMTLSLAWLPLAVFVLAAGAAILSSDQLPRWLAYLALPAGALLLASSAGFINPQGTLAAIGPLAMILSLIWVLSTSIVMLRRNSDVSVSAAPNRQTGGTVATPAT